MKRLIRNLRSFRENERGSIAIETVLIIPALFTIYMTMFSVFDVYRQHSINYKAAYTAGDILSRQTIPINAPYLTGLRQTVAYLTHNTTENVSIRVTSVQYDDTDKEYKLDWSEARGDARSPLSESQVQALADNLPVMPDQEYVTIVETFVDYSTPFNIGIADTTIETFVFTRPRYAPRVCWISCN